MIYFASDFHLGAPNYQESRIREEKIVRWFESIKKDVTHLYLVGDLFDYWYEYKSFVPKFYIRFLGKLAELADNGVEIYIFSGNHDVWFKDYFIQEIGAKIIHEPISVEHGSASFYVGHGDGLGPGDLGYKFIRKVFRNRVCQWIYSRIHPDTGYKIAHFFSWLSSSKNRKYDQVFLGDTKEWLIIHSKKVNQKKTHNYYIYGHRHLPLEYKISSASTVINLGDWLTNFTYAVFDGTSTILKTFE